MAEVIPPIAYELMKFLRKVKSLEEHDSKLDDLASVSKPPSSELLAKKRQFRSMVNEIVRKTNCPEEEAVKEVANYIYGRVLDGLPTDGQSRHG